MRPKIVIAILLLAAGLLVVIVLMTSALRPQSTSTPAASATPATASNNPVAVPASNHQPVVAVGPTASTNAAPVADTNAAAAHAKYVEQRIEELDALAWHNDIKSRDTILSELKNNPDKEIRAAALEAAIQFNDRSVVPPMREIAGQTEDPGEKAAILEAIDFINLPSLTEVRRMRAKGAPKGAPAQTQQSQ